MCLSCYGKEEMETQENLVEVTVEAGQDIGTKDVVSVEEAQQLTQAKETDFWQLLGQVLSTGGPFFNGR